MKPMQISGPWNDGLITAHPVWEGMCCVGGVKGAGVMYHFSCVHVFSAAGLSMRSCLEHSGFQVTDTIHGIV